MAHNLASINGQISYAYQGQTPWHKLGTRVQSLTSPAAALTAAHLDWRVALEDMFLADGRKVDDRRAVVRDTDRAVLGTVGPQQTLLQNDEWLSTLDVACREHGVTIESIGALGNGARTFALAKLPETVTPIAGDDIRGYFLLQNAHDGSGSDTAKATPIRVVCQNTLNIANSGNRDLIRIPHRKSIAERHTDIARMVADLLRVFKATGDTFATLAAKQLDHAGVVAYIESVFPAAENGDLSDTIIRKRRIVHDLTYRGAGAEMAGSNATTGASTPWALYNAVTEYIDHVRPGDAKSSSAKAAANESAMFGTGAALKLQAFVKARELVRV